MENFYINDSLLTVNSISVMIDLFLKSITILMSLLLILVFSRYYVKPNIVEGKTSAVQYVVVNTKKRKKSSAVLRIAKVPKKLIVSGLC